jgi:hypothetical protein
VTPPAPIRPPLSLSFDWMHATNPAMSSADAFSVPATTRPASPLSGRSSEEPTRPVTAPASSATFSSSSRSSKDAPSAVIACRQWYVSALIFRLSSRLSSLRYSVIVPATPQTRMLPCLASMSCARFPGHAANLDCLADSGPTSLFLLLVPFRGSSGWQPRAEDSMRQRKAVVQ